MKIKNNERHKMNRGKLDRCERDNAKERNKKKIKEARKNKQLQQEFASRYMDEIFGTENF